MCAVSQYIKKDFIVVPQVGAMSQSTSVFSSSSLPDRLLRVYPAASASVCGVGLVNFMLEALLEHKRFKFPATEARLLRLLTKDLHSCILGLGMLADENPCACRVISCPLNYLQIRYEVGSDLTRRMFAILRKCEIDLLKIINDMPELVRNGEAGGHHIKIETRYQPD